MNSQELQTYLKQVPLEDTQPHWYKDLRQKGAETFAQAGFPTPKIEQWRYTNLSPFLKETYRLAPSQQFEVSSLFSESLCFVFVNGVLQSAPEKLPKGLRFSSLKKDAEALPLNVQEKMGTVGNPKDYPLLAMNTALHQDGACLIVEEGVHIQQPLEVIFYEKGVGTFCAPRAFVHLEKNAQAVLVERHLGEGSYFTNAAVEISLDRNSALNHYRINQEDDQALHIAHTQVEVSQDAHYMNFSVTTGAKLSRNDIRVVLKETGSHVDLFGAYLLREKQHCDTTTFIDHASAQTTSDEVYKGVLGDHSKGVFQGKIVVRKDSQKIEGNQLSRALLLSDKAQVNTKPELEIYADDVICSHGATVGDLDAQALFYLKARGIPENQARKLLIEAFMQEALEKIPDLIVAEKIQEIQQQWLQENLL